MFHGADARQPVAVRAKASAWTSTPATSTATASRRSSPPPTGRCRSRGYSATSAIARCGRVQQEFDSSTRCSLADVGGDARPEVLVGDGQWGDAHDLPLQRGDERRGRRRSDRLAGPRRHVDRRRQTSTPTARSRSSGAPARPAPAPTALRRSPGVNPDARPSSGRARTRFSRARFSSTGHSLGGALAGGPTGRPAPRRSFPAATQQRLQADARLVRMPG